MAESASTPYSNSKVGRFVESAAVLEVAARLLVEGLKKLDENYESALVALRQSFALERQFGDDAERLCRATAALCVTTACEGVPVRSAAKSSSTKSAAVSSEKAAEKVDDLDAREDILLRPPDVTRDPRMINASTRRHA